MPCLLTDIQLRHNIATGVTQKADLSSLQDLCTTQALANTPTAVSTPQNKTAPKSTASQTESGLTIDTHSQTHPVLGLPPLVGTDASRVGMSIGREARVLPTGNVGEFRSPIGHHIALESFSAEAGMAHVPVLNKVIVCVSSKFPKHPVISSRSVVTVLSHFNRIHGLPRHIEYVHCPDATLVLMKSILEYNSNQMPPGSQLTAFISDFEVDVSLTAQENCAEIQAILKLFSDHPQGNAVRFSQVYVYPRHCKLPQMSDPKIPKSTTNYF